MSAFVMSPWRLLAAATTAEKPGISEREHVEAEERAESRLFCALEFMVVCWGIDPSDALPRVTVAPNRRELASEMDRRRTGVERDLVRVRVRVRVSVRVRVRVRVRARTTVVPGWRDREPSAALNAGSEMTSENLAKVACVRDEE